MGGRSIKMFARTLWGTASSTAHYDAHLLPKPKLAFAVEYSLQGYPAHPVRQKNQQMLWPASKQTQPPVSILANKRINNNISRSRWLLTNRGEITIGSARATNVGTGHKGTNASKAESQFAEETAIDCRIFLAW